MSPIPVVEEIEVAPGLSARVLPTSKLKTVAAKCFLAADLDETVTARALLPQVLQRGTARHPDLQAIERRLDELYGASLASHVYKIGEWHVIRFQLECVNDRFLPGGGSVLAGACRFLAEVLREPRVEGEGFAAEYVEQEKEQLRRRIESLVDDKGAYAVQRAIEEMCPDEPYRLYELGRAADLPRIDRTSLYRLYRDALERRPVSFYIAGDIAPERGAELARIVLPERSDVRAPLRPLPPVRAARGPREVEERMDVNQAKLVLGYRHGIRIGDALYPSLLVMNAVLGQAGFTQSKLFQNVREKASLAYYAHSWIERTKGFLFIAVGTSPSTRRRALEITLEQVDAMRRGDFSDGEFEVAVRMLLNQNLMAEDDPAGLADAHFAWALHGAGLDLEELRSKLQAVTRDGVVEAASRLAHDITYILTAEGEP